jgi:DNA polymerase-3 subunit gamma/tau
MLAALVGCPVDLLLHVSPNELPELKASAEALGLETILAMVQILDQAVTRMRQSTHVRTLAEIALVRICRLEDLDQLPQLLGQIRDNVPLSAAAPRPAAAPRSQTPLSAATAALDPATDQKKSIRIDEGELVSDANSPSPSLTPLTPQSAASIWQQALTELGDMTADYARKAESVANCGPNRLVARFGKAYSGPKEYCERPERKAKLQQALGRIVGSEVRLEFELIAGSPEQDLAHGLHQPLATGRERNRQAAQHPLVRQAMELFDAEVLHVLQPAPAGSDGDEAGSGGPPGDEAATVTS